MTDKQEIIRQRDMLDIEAMKRQLNQVSEDIPRMTGHYVQAVSAADPHIFQSLMTAKSLIDLASQQLSHAHLWLLPDDDDDNAIPTH